MASVFKQKYKGRDGKQRESKSWYAEFHDHNGTTRRVVGFSEKGLTQELGRKLDKLSSFRRLGQSPDAELIHWLESIPSKLRGHLAKWGLLDARSEGQSRGLRDHLADFRQSILDRGKTNGHAKTTCQRIEAILDGCGFVFHSDISASVIERYLADRRSGGLGIKSTNHYLSAFKAFVRWLVQNRRAGDDPISHMKPLNAAVDVRRDRRSLSRAEFSRLVQVTGTQPTLYGLSGRDRQMLYLTAAYTGLRAGELGSLTERSLDFSTDPATVTVIAGDSKHRKKDVLPLHEELCVRLQGWLSDRKQAADEAPVVLSIGGSRTDEKLWPGRWAVDRRAARFLKKDLAAAGIEYHDENGRVFDFHALRGQFVTELGRAGVSLQEAQKLARHSDPKLTANHYTHLSVHDLGNSVGKLPSLPGSHSETVQATGTDQSEGSPENHSVDHSAQGAPLCASTHDSGKIEKTGSQSDSADFEEDEKQNPCRPQGLGRHGSKNLEGWITGFEPATSGTTIQRSNQLSYIHHLQHQELLKGLR